MSEVITADSDYKQMVDLLAVYSTAANRLKALETEANASFLKLIEAFKREYADLQQLQTDASAGLEKIARAHPEWFAKKKSVATPFGTIKFHSSTKLEVKNEEASILLIETQAELEASSGNHQDSLRMIDCIKTVQALNLEALEGFTDETLKLFRIKRVPKDNFSIEPKELDMGKAVKAALETKEAA